MLGGSQAASRPKLERIVREVGGDVAELKTTHTAVDRLALRGLPAIGRAVVGAIRGTSPHGALMAKQPR
jgi:hypothetical protein